MALTTSKSINLSGQSVINGVTVETYTASCSEDMCANGLR